MATSKVEYIYEDEDGHEYTAEEPLHEDDMLDEQDNASGQYQEVMIVDNSPDMNVSLIPESLVHDLNHERDPDCKRKGWCFGVTRSFGAVWGNALKFRHVSVDRWSSLDFLSLSFPLTEVQAFYICLCLLKWRAFCNFFQI